MNLEEDWNPDKACEEMAELFRQTDQIMSKPLYQEDASGDELQTPTTGSLPNDRSKRT
ncbi:MAG: hypothetical protein F6K28_13195 [Microcoleus sp. SIO2G3]|nr:hypothetical protein [Microcoleus sp. SIO2G3]